MTRPSRSRPPSRCRTCRCGWVTTRSRRCRTRSSPIPRPGRRSRSGLVRSSWRARPTPSSCSPSSPTTEGTPKPNVDKVTIRIYQDSAAAYADVVANNLDYLDTIPPDQLVGEAFKDDLPDRWLQREAGRFTSVTFSAWDPQMKNNVELRKALSMAIDRNLIADKVFNGTVTPATGWVSPVVDGYKAGACGEYCVFDAAKAKAAYDAAGGYKGTLTMTYNADNAINKAYSEAICNSIKNAVGADCRAVPTVDFATFQNKLDAKELKGMFRSGWADGLPVDRELPGSALRQGGHRRGRLELLRVQQPGVREARSLRRRQRRRPTRPTRCTSRLRHCSLRTCPVAPLWYPKTTVGLLRQGDQRQGRCVRATRSGSASRRSDRRSRWDRGELSARRDNPAGRRYVSFRRLGRR